MIITTNSVVVVHREATNGASRKEGVMRTFLSLLVAAFVIVAFSTAGFAQMQNATAGKTEAVGKKMESPEKAMSYTGKVLSINEVDHMLVVKGKEGDRTFDISGVSVDTIKTGQNISVKYTEKSGKMIATSVSVGEKTAMKTHTRHGMVKTSMKGPGLGYEPYKGFDPYFYGYDGYSRG
jgi:hypothetical protein